MRVILLQDAPAIYLAKTSYFYNKEFSSNLINA